MDGLKQDLIAAARFLRRRLSFTVAALSALALGIGAATAMFSIADGVLLRPLVYSDPSRLLTVWITYPHWRDDPQLGDRWDRMGVPYPRYTLLREQSATLSEVAAYKVEPMAVKGGLDPADAIDVGHASSNLMPVLRVAPRLGRWFLPGEEGAGAPRVAVLSEELWRTRFGGEADVTGKSLRLDDGTYEIIGVMPSLPLRALKPGTDGTGRPQVWIPIGATGEDLHPFSYEFEIVARLAPDASVAAASDEIAPILRADYEPAQRGVRILPRREAEVGSVRAPMILLLAAVALLLIVACGNVAALLLGEAPQREAEMATRAALGAKRSRLMRQLLVENIVLALAGSLLGILIATVATKMFVALAPANLPRMDEVVIDARVLLFAILAAIGTAVGFGLLPALSLSRTHQTVRTGRGSTRHRGWWQSALLASQMALCTLLLITAGLLMRSLAQERNVDPGFDAANLVSLRIDASSFDLEPAARSALVSRVVEVVRGVPGVTAATATKTLPYSGRRQSWTVHRPDRKSTEEVLHARRHAVLPGFLEVMGIPLRAGRSFLPSEAENVALVNETMARSMWPEGSALGRTLVTPNGPLTVIGVVADTRDEGLDLASQPTFYSSWPQRPENAVTIVVRVEHEGPSMVRVIEQAVRRLEPELPVAEVTTMNTLIAATLDEERFRSVLMACFGGAAALLAILGLGGVTARAVGQRRRELGIRAAVGARPLRLVREAMQQLVLASAGGVAAGCAAALLTSKVLEAYLFGVASSDPATYLGIAGLMVTSAITASVIPARAAAAIAPAEILRE